MNANADTREKPQTDIAVFGGGCFWCTEAVFKMLNGVRAVAPGYAGGPSTGSAGSPQASSGQAPTYEEVCGGATGHAEVTRIEYDPAEISYRDLLTVFFATHDPTTPNRQGNDIGSQYRSIILYASDEQRREAEKFIWELNASHPDGKPFDAAQGKPIVTEVKPLERFWPAEDYHRDYYAKNPEKAYCQVVVNPKLEKVQQKFAELLKPSCNPRG